MYAVTEDKGEFQKNCFCHKEHVNSICQYCISIRSSLNFLCHKICVEDNEYFRNFLRDHKAVPLNDYLEKIPCEPFFIFDNNRVSVCLDNPEVYVPQKTDSRPVLFRS